MFFLIIKVTFSLQKTWGRQKSVRKPGYSLSHRAEAASTEFWRISFQMCLCLFTWLSSQSIQFFSFSFYVIFVIQVFLTPWDIVFVDGCRIPLLKCATSYSTVPLKGNLNICCCFDVNSFTHGDSLTFEFFLKLDFQ